MVLEVFAATTASMSIIDCEELRTDAIFFDVESDTDSIFIVIPCDTCMGIDGVCFYNSILFS